MLKSNALGIMNQMWAAHATSDAEAIATAIEETLLAEELGFDSVWIGEHHNVRPGARFYGRIPASEMFLAHLAAKTTRIALGTGVRILSTTPPQRTAEEMSLLDLLSGGRAEFGVGLGSTPDVKPGDPARAVKAALFRSLLSDIVSYLSGTAEGAPISPAPAPDLAARIWAAARDQATLAHIADAGINLVVGQAELPPIQAAIVQAYRAAGGTGLVRGVRLVFVAETHAEAMRDADEALSLYLGQMGGKGYHSEAIAKGLLAADPRTLEERGLGVNFLIGSPEEVAALLNDYVAETGVDRLDLMVQVPGLRTDAVRRSMALIQQAVKPLLKRALPQPAIA